MPQPFTVLKDGNATLAAAGTAQQLTTTPTPCGQVNISAGENNQGDILIGGVTVVGAANGRRGNTLVPNASITLAIDDLSKVWFDGTNTGDTVNYSYLA